MTTLRQYLDEKHARSINFRDVMDDIVKRSWGSFELHRHSMKFNFHKIKNIRWIDLDEVEYEKLFVNIESVEEDYKPFLLCSSVYIHTSLDKCFPSNKDCIECYKYFCFNCGRGTNSYYSGCDEFRCATNIDLLSPKLFDIVSRAKRVYYFRNENYENY